MKKKYIILISISALLLGIGLFFLIYNLNHTTIKSFDNSSSFTINTGKASYVGDNAYKIDSFDEGDDFYYKFLKDRKTYSIENGHLFIEKGRIYSLTYTKSQHDCFSFGDRCLSSPYVSLLDEYKIVGIGFLTLMNQFKDSEGNYIFRKKYTDFETEEEYLNYYEDMNKPNLTRWIFDLEYDYVIEILDNLDSKYVTKTENKYYLNILDNDGNLTDHKLEVGSVEVENKKYAYFDTNNLCGYSKKNKIHIDGRIIKQ